jgi:hypothetical protein
VLSGALLMFIFNYIGMNILLNFILSIVIMTGWEFFELYFLGVKEHLPNKIMDVVTGILGFGVMLYFVSIYGLTSLWSSFWIILVVWLLLNFLGLYAFYSRET